MTILGEANGGELRERDEEIDRLLKLMDKAREELDHGTEAFKQLTETLEFTRKEHAETLGRETTYREVLKHAGELLATFAGNRHPSEKDLEDAEITADQIRHILK